MLSKCLSDWSGVRCEDAYFGSKYEGHFALGGFYDSTHCQRIYRKSRLSCIGSPVIRAFWCSMNVCSNQEELERFLQLAANVSKKHPVVVSQFIEHAKEVEMDAVAQNGEIVAYAISEHIEFAGVHSGDATIQFPPQKLYVETVRRIKRISRQIAKELNISGPFNIQFLARENDIKVIECNLRASRSFPFVSKVLKINFIELATKVMLGLPVEKPEKNLFDLDYVGIKPASSRSTVCRRPTLYWV